jgi:AcrR family transcriptional regulator
MSESKRERSWQAGPLRIRVTLPDDAPPRPKERLTVERIVDAAMDLMADKGYDAVSMRSLAKALDTGPASLYAHVANKEQLDELVLDRIAGELELPEPDPDRWQEQLREVLRDILGLFRRHPGSARAALATIPTSGNVMRVTDGLLAIAIGGGVSPQAAAWFCDLASLYTSAIAYEESIWAGRMVNPHDGTAPDHEAIDAQMIALMEQVSAELPFVGRFGRELATGDGDDRFEFGIDVLVAGLAAVSEKYR